jgi:hypothetical protein
VICGLELLAPAGKVRIRFRSGMRDVERALPERAGRDNERGVVNGLATLEDDAAAVALLGRRLDAGDGADLDGAVAVGEDLIDRVERALVGVALGGHDGTDESGVEDLEVARVDDDKLVCCGVELRREALGDNDTGASTANDDNLCA